MKEITACPSTLEKGYDTYCPVAIKYLFDGKRVSHILSFSLEDEEDQDVYGIFPFRGSRKSFRP